MQRKNYKILSLLNLLLGVCAICLFLPTTLKAFSVKGFDWLDFAPDLFKDNYINVEFYFGLFLIVWFIVINAISLLSRPNLSKTLFKLSTIVALALPLMFVLAVKYEFALEFWIKNIAPEIKTIALVVLCVSAGLFALGLILNFVRRNRANLHIVLQALVMCAFLGLLIAAEGWCGWKVDILKMVGVLYAVFAIYLPISSIVLLICAKSRD